MPGHIDIEYINGGAIAVLKLCNAGAQKRYQHGDVE